MDPGEERPFRGAFLEEADGHAGGPREVVFVVSGVVLALGEDEAEGDVEDDLVGGEVAKGHEATPARVAEVAEGDARLERGIVGDAREPGEEIRSVVALGGARDGGHRARARAARERRGGRDAVRARDDRRRAHRRAGRCAPRRPRRDDGRSRQRV